MRDHVLIVNDSLAVRADLADAFAAAGFTVLPCATIAEARVELARGPVGTVILDAVLAEGVDLLREVRASPTASSTAVLMLSAGADVDERIRGLDGGVDEVVGKPYDRAYVVAKARELLRMRRGEPAAFLTRKRILAVDDSATFLNEVSDVLRAEGYDVTMAHSGEEAIEVLAAQAVDCILIGVTMPGIGGLETCRRIKATPGLRDVPLLLMTLLDDRAAVVDGLGAGADDFVANAGDLTVLAARVHAQLRRQQSEVDTIVREREAGRRAARELAEARAVLVGEAEQAREQMEHVSQFRSKFLANMSHELRTPLNAIIGFSEILGAGDAGVLNEEQQDYVATVLDSARCLLNLITEILDLSRIEAGRLELYREPLDLAPIFSAVRDQIGSQAVKHDVALEWDVAPDLPAVHADPARLKEILVNLLSNAVKFTPAGGTARLRASVEDGRLVLAVSDTGMGIRLEDRSRLFQEFERIHTNASSGPDGTGLGLALTQRLIRLHGGTIDVDSEPGRGSTFTVRLPLRPETAN